MPAPISYTTNHKYEIVPYSSEWPLLYKNEATLLKEIFGDTAIDTQHVGSTAIPGMTAKPQLDILMQVKIIKGVDAFNKKMQEAGYTVYGDALRKNGRLFSRWDNDAKVVNLHIYQPESPVAREYLAVRDYLLSHPQEAKAYEAFKLKLYKKYPADYLKYREHKDQYMTELIKRIGS